MSLIINAGLILLLSAASLFSVHSQQITNTTLLDGNVACAGVMVTFTCETVGSLALAWSSDHYIGTGGTEITFTAIDYYSSNSEKRSNDYPDTYATITAVNSSDQSLTSELHIMASVRTSLATTSSVTCRHTDDNRRATQMFHVFGPGSPGNLIAIRIANTLANQCFITAIWQRLANDAQAGVTYLVRSNERAKFSKTIDTTRDTADWLSASFQDTCETGHMISVTAGSVCGTGPPIVYNTTESQGECSELNIEHIPRSCYATVERHATTYTPPPTYTSPTPNVGEKSNGNVNLIIISGFMATAILLFGS